MRYAVWMLALAALAACEAPPAPTGLPAAETDATQRTFGMNLKLSEAGVLKADVYGDTAYQQPGNADVTELRNVRLTFFDQGGKKPGTLTSRTGEYNVQSGVMIARGNVVLVTYDEKGVKRTVRTEELYYDQRGDRVWSERETIVEKQGESFVSQSFTSDTRFTNIQGTNARSTGVQVNANGGGL
jgi:LPS export ABC transporter protein LptC